MVQFIAHGKTGKAFCGFDISKEFAYNPLSLEAVSCIDHNIGIIKLSDTDNVCYLFAGARLCYFNSNRVGASV